MGGQFLNLNQEFSHPERAKWVIIQAPFDASVCYRPGARLGPQAIVEASSQLEHFDEELLCEPYRVGIHTQDPIEPVIDPRQMSKLVYEEALKSFEMGKRVCLLGGDHSVSIGAIQAAHQVHGRLNLVQFDAHLDLRDSYQGSTHSHACTMRRVWDMVNPIQIGIRSFSKEEFEFLRSQAKPPISAGQIHSDPQGSLEEMKARVQPDLPTYVTLDLDCLDPSIMPAVGTPEPGGLLWYQILSFLREITTWSNVVGFDCVELAPIPGMNFPEFTAARLIYKVIGYCHHG